MPTTMIIRLQRILLADILGTLLIGYYFRMGDWSRVGKNERKGLKPNGWGERRGDRQ